jgi:hypothetical protein
MQLGIENTLGTLAAGQKGTAMTSAKVPLRSDAYLALSIVAIALKSFTSNRFTLIRGQDAKTEGRPNFGKIVKNLYASTINVPPPSRSRIFHNILHGEKDVYSGRGSWDVFNRQCSRC